MNTQGRVGLPTASPRQFHPSSVPATNCDEHRWLRWESVMRFGHLDLVLPRKDIQMSGPTDSAIDLALATITWSQRTVSRRTLLRAGGALGIAAASVPILQACSSSSDSGSAGGTYSMWALSSTSAMMQYFAKKYQAVNKDFKLNITEVPSGSSHRAKIITSAGSGNLPDLLDDSMNYGSDFATYTLFEPLDKYFNGEDV